MAGTRPDDRIRRIITLFAGLTLVATVLGAVGASPTTPDASAQVPISGPADSDAEFLLCGRVFSDPHAFWPSPTQAAGKSPFAKGSAACAQSDFLTYADMISGMEYLESLYPDFVDFQELEEDYGLDRDCATTLDSDALCSAGLPTVGADGLTRTRSDLYMVRLTDERVTGDKKLFTFPLSIHGIERAGAEAGVRAAEDLAVWGYCEAVAAGTLAGNGRTDCSLEGAVPYPLMETLASSITAGEALARSEIYLVFANPDGWRRGDPENGTRSFQRYNGNGVDMNRDWPTEGFTFRPYTPWSEPETRSFGEAMQSISDTWDGGIDLHGQNIDRAFSFTLLGASQRDFGKNQRILQTVKGAYEDAENRLSWSSLIKPNDADADDPRMYGVQWGTVWDTIGYTVTGSLGDWIDSPIGLGADGIDNEMSFSHLYNCGTGTCYVAENEQLHVDGNKSLIYAMVNFSLLPEDQHFEVPGDKIGYVLDDTVLTSTGAPPPPDYTGFPQQPGVSDVQLDVTNNWTHAFEVLAPEDGFYNGGVVGTATLTNLGGISGSSLQSLLIERYRGTESDPDSLTASCGSNDEWQTINEYFNQSVIYLQGGQAVHANSPLPGWWRICLTGGLENAGTSPVATLDVDFTPETAWADPGQVPYSVTNMAFFTELGEYMDPGQLEAIHPDDVLSGAVDLTSYRSIVIADDPFPGYSEPPATGPAQPGEFFDGPPPAPNSGVGVGVGTAPCAYSPGLQDVLPPSCANDFEFDIDPAFNNQQVTIALDTLNEGIADWDLYLERQSRVTGEWFPVAQSTTSSGDETITLLTPPIGHYRVRVVNWDAEPTSARTLSIDFSNVYAGPPIPPSTRSQQDLDTWAGAFRAYVEQGGNLVLTDGALRNLTYMDLAPRTILNTFTVYAGFIGFTADGTTDTYDDPLADNVNQPGAAEGPNHRHQTYEPVPIGFAIQDDGGSDFNASPIWGFDQIEWEALGGRTVGITTADQVTLGELEVGAGAVRIVGALVPMPSQQYYHPYGLADYAVTYTGYQVLNNALQWHGMGGLPPDAVDDSGETDDVTPIDIAVLDNDVDPEGGALSIVSFTQPAQGAVTDNGDGTLHYTPEHGAVGTFTFEYTIADPEGLTDSATVTINVSDHHELDPARNTPLPCEAVNTPGAVPRAAFDMVHLANVCGIVGTDVEFQSRTAADGTVHDYAFVGTMGYGFRIYDVTDPSAPTIAGGFQDTGWQNDVQVRGDVVVSTFDGVVGEPSTTSTCLAAIPGSSGQGVDIFRLNFDPVTATFTTANPACVANPPGGAHNATLHPSGDWLAISNCCSDWAMDLVDLRDLDAGNAVHTYRFIDGTRRNAAGRCPPAGVSYTCVVVQGPGGSDANGRWQPHDVFFSGDGDTMYVAAIQSTFIVDVSDALDGTIETISIIGNADPGDPDPSAQISTSHQSDTTADGTILVVTDENGGGVTATGCNTSSEGKIGAAHFYALAPIPGEPSTAAASPANPVKLGIYVNPNPLFAPDELQDELAALGRTERACTIHVFRIGGNGTSSPGPIQAGFDGVSTVGGRQFVTGWYGAGVWYVDFSGRPSDGDDHAEDPRTTWGNTLGFINMPGADTWSAKEYRGHVYAGDMSRGFDVYGFADCDNPVECTLVVPLNNAPVAQDDAATVDDGQSVVIEVLANDSDPDGDPLTVQSFTQGASGTVSDNLDGTLTYTHDGSGPGSDTFTYTVSDGRGKTDQATVSITIMRPNRDPVAGDDTAETRVDTPVAIEVLANDSDPDGDPLQVDEVTAPANGEAADNGDGTITYTPDPGFAGTDSFTYTVGDGRGGTDTATVTVTVTDPDACRNALCADGDKPDELTFTFVGGTCADSENTQGSKADCVDHDAAGASGTVLIRATNKEDPDYDNAKVWFEGVVSEGESFTISAAAAGEKDFGSKVFLHIYTADGLTLLQTVEVHTSCSAPLVEGEQFGSLQLGDDTADPNAPICSAGEGRVHGSGRWDRGTGDKHDKIDFSFDAKFYKGSLKGKLKVKDKDLDVKIDAKTITSLSTGAGVDCGGVVLDGATSFAFSASGTFEQGDVETSAEFFACGIDNGKNNDPPFDYFYVEVTAGPAYSTGDRASDNDIDGGNIHLHDPIVDPTGGSAAAGPPEPGATGSAEQAQEGDSSAEPTVVSLDPILLDTVPAGAPFVLTAVVESPAGLLTDAPVTLRWVTEDGSTGSVTSITNTVGVATFVVVVPFGDVDYTATTVDGLESNGVRIEGI